MLHMDVGRSTRSLGKVSTFYSIQELAMARTSDHVGLAGSIRDFGVEGMSWGNGRMDLLDLKNSSERLRGEDVDLNMSHGFRVFIRHLSPIILRLLVISHFLQHLPEHLGDVANITSIMLELANISVQKMNL
jgi:hypothetical protein